MAACTILAELPMVLILVAAYALARKTEISVIQVFDDNPRPRWSGNELHFVALLAGYTTVLSRKREASLAVIHGLALGLPVNQGKIDSVVIGVTPRALFVIGGICPQPEGVHAATLPDSLADLCMTFKAFELFGAPAQPMTFGTVCRS